MTDDLQTLLHDRAAGADLGAVDLLAVTRDGSARVRRRRAATYAGGLALAAVLGTLGATALGGGPLGDDGRAVDPAGAPTAAAGAAPTWYSEGRLHHDGTSTDLGLDVVTYARTAHGFVLVDARDVVWSWTGGEPVEVGRSAEAFQRVAGDLDGALAAWVDTSGAARVLRVLDQRERTVVDRGEVGTGEAAVTAVDGDRVWWREGAASLTWSGTGVPEQLPDDTTVLAAAGGMIVHQDGTTISVSDGIVPSSDARVLDREYRDVGALSTDGRLWSADADELLVWRTDDGSYLDTRLERPFATGVEWLDTDTLVVLAGRATEGSQASERAMRAEILVCDVLTTNPCRTVADDLGTFDDLDDGDFALPVGIEIG